MQGELEKLGKFGRQIKREVIRPYDSYTEINSILWAPRNVGANTKSEPGRYFNLYDVRNACPGNWRLPTEKEWNDLVNHGYTFTADGVDFGTGGNRLLLPYIGRGKEENYHYKFSEEFHLYGEYCGSAERDQVFSVAVLNFRRIVTLGEGGSFISGGNSEEYGSSMEISVSDRDASTLCIVRCVLDKEIVRKQQELLQGMILDATKR